MSELLTNTSPPSPSLDRPHVLVVDDDDRLRELLRRYLAENGFLVATAADAARARAKLTSLTFDVIVLDLMMPGESGLDFARALRRGGDLPILMLTAKDGEWDEAEALDTGADDFLAKPFSFVVLLARLRALARRPPTPRPAIRCADSAPP